MRKLLSLLTAVLFVGVGNAWALSSVMQIGASNYPSAATGKTVSGSNGVTWAVESDAKYWNGNDNGAIHGGSGSKTVSYIEFTSGDFTGKTITSIKVTARCASSNSTASATINGSAFGSATAAYANSLSEKTISADGVAVTGNVVVRVARATAAQSAIYVSKIEVVYTSSCTNLITITQGSNPANGTFTIDNSGDVCIDDGNASTTVNATPEKHYHLATVTSLAEDGETVVGQVGEINGKTCTITDIDDDTEIAVTFAEDPHHTVTWNINGDKSTTTEVYDGEKPVFPDTPSSFDATSTAFYGWATTAWSGKITDISDKTIYKTASSMPNVNGADVEYFAVFAKATPGAAIDGTEGGDFCVYTEISSTKYYAMAFASKIDNTTDVSRAGVYTFERSEANDKVYFAIKSNGKYLGYGTTGTSFTTGNTSPYSWEVQTGEGVHGTWRLKTTTGSTPRAFAFNGTQFGPYAISNIDGEDYYDIGIEVAPSYSDYTTTKDTGTALDNTEVGGKAVKLLRNGILLIEKNGHTYNAMGQLVK